MRGRVGEREEFVGDIVPVILGIDCGAAPEAYAMRGPWWGRKDT